MKSGGAGSNFSRAWLVVCLALVLVASVGIVLLRQRSGPPPLKTTPAPLERARADLTLRDGRLFDGAAPFTGIVTEQYPDGGLKSRSVVSNGLLEGLSEGWYTNGVLQVTEHFHLNVSHGIRTKFYPDGGKMSEVNVMNGVLEGVYQKWHENGKLAERVELKAGQPDGESVAYFPDGSLKAQVTLSAGQVLTQKFWAQGEMPGLAHTN